MHALASYRFYEAVYIAGHAGQEVLVRRTVSNINHTYKNSINTFRVVAPVVCDLR